MLVDNLIDVQRSQFFLASGGGEGTSLRILRAGVEVQESLRVQLPFLAISVFTLRASVRFVQDRYLVISFNSSTMVLVICQGAVNQVLDSGILTDIYTHKVKLMADDSVVQVICKGIYHLARGGRGCSWSCPNKLAVVSYAVVDTLVSLSLSGGVIVFLELDTVKNRLAEMNRRTIGELIISMDILENRGGCRRTFTIAVASQSSQLTLFALYRGSVIEQIFSERMDTMYVSALSFMYTRINQLLDTLKPFCCDSRDVYLYVGAQNGILMRARVGSIQGVLGSFRWRYVGMGGVRLIVAKVEGRALLFVFSRFT